MTNGLSRLQIFNRSALLTGTDVLDNIGRKRGIVFGMGGVGSWAAETLVRSGFRNITIVDADNVAISNINRQLPATSSTVGMSKVEVMRQRLTDINPDVEITAIHGFYNASTQSQYILGDYDYIIDAIDSLSDKALLILNATRAESSDGSHPLFCSSMGAALKTDPSRIAVTEFWKVKGCPLAAALRRKFKKTEQFPSHKFKCVYSDELVQNHPDSARLTDESGAMNFNKVASNGSLMHITSIFGITLASIIVRHYM